MFTRQVVYPVSVYSPAERRAQPVARPERGCRRLRLLRHLRPHQQGRRVPHHFLRWKGIVSGAVGGFGCGRCDVRIAATRPWACYTARPSPSPRRPSSFSWCGCF